MTHEFKDIITYYALHASKHKAVLATVVALDGSSYRKPGVRMLILDNGNMIGAVSGGCVENEILRRSKAVFSSGVAQIMHYDGRYRLGCEGLLYILIEPFEIQEKVMQLFSDSMKQRTAFTLHSFYLPEEVKDSRMGTYIRFADKSYYSLNATDELTDVSSRSNLLSFEQLMAPCFKLIIIGAEHDAVQLSLLAAATAWEVDIICGPKEHKTIKDFPGAKKLEACASESLQQLPIDAQTAIVMMTHNYAKDLQHLIGLKNTKPVYIGILGAAKRREKLLMEFLEYCPEVDTDFLDLIHSPTGLDIGAIGPKEIAISIIAEILSIVRKKNVLEASMSKEKWKIES